MNPHLQKILSVVSEEVNLSEEQKSVIIKSLKDANKEIDIINFKLDRTEKVKRTTAILLEETIEELELKRKAVEAQNRELEIEAALEKVRSRTMAMQHSDELAETSFVLDTQVRALGIKTRGCAFNIYGDNDSTEWFSSEQGKLPAYKTPRESFYLRFYEAGQRGEALYIEQYDGELCKEHYEYLCTLPVLGDVLRAMIENGGSFPEKQIDHVVYFKYGHLLFITFEEVPEAHEIFKRFAQVFEQTYTRFLDLKRAEAQTRQAEHDLLEIKAARKKAEQALNELQVTQAQLIQSEKLASLGELTAGIAHEIQNPLNFVNNFSELSVDLVKDLKDEIEKSSLTSEGGILIMDKAYFDELFYDLSQNQEKINHHGKRASSIVKGMLEHSRASTGVKELTDINQIADEYLRLAYHGLRAKDKTFNADFKTEFDKDLPKIAVIPQDIGRVLLNMINNAFYAVSPQTPKGKLPTRNLKVESYMPTVTVSTHYQAFPSGAANTEGGGSIIIRIKDNGIGMSEETRAKIFQPFFTTKPTGQGTGLGLSLAYDIVTKGHGGTLEVLSTEGVGSEFIIRLPIKNE